MSLNKLRLISTSSESAPSEWNSSVSTFGSGIKSLIRDLARSKLLAFCTAVTVHVINRNIFILSLDLPQAHFFELASGQIRSNLKVLYKKSYFGSRMANLRDALSNFRLLLQFARFIAEYWEKDNMTGLVNPVNIWTTKNLDDHSLGRGVRR